MTDDGTPELTEADALTFRAQLGISEPIDGELLDTPEDRLPTPDSGRVFALGYAIGRSTVEAEAAADAVFTRARRRRLALDALAVGLGWFVGSLIADGVNQ